MKKKDSLNETKEISNLNFINFQWDTVVIIIIIIFNSWKHSWKQNENVPEMKKYEERYKNVVQFNSIQFFSNKMLIFFEKKTCLKMKKHSVCFLKEGRIFKNF